MKGITIKLFLVMLFCNIAAISYSDNLSVENITMKQGEAKVISINFNNEKEMYTSFQFNMYLPKGIDPKKLTSGGVVTEVPEDRYENPSSQTTYCGSRHDDDSYVFICFSASNSLIIGNEGSILDVTLQASADIEPGTYKCKLGKIEFAEQENVDAPHPMEDVSFTITIEENEPVILDENSTVLPTPKNTANVQLKRTLVGGKWNTLVLPFDLCYDDVLKYFGTKSILAKFSSASTENGSTTIVFNRDRKKGIKANEPCLLKPENDGDEYMITDVDIVTPAVSNVIHHNLQFTGTYVNGNKVPEGDYYIFDNKFYKSANLSNIKGFRGYFHPLVENNTKLFNISLDSDGETTNIESIYIYDNSEMGIYNLNGQKIRDNAHDTTDLPKGVYIINGKKSIIR